MSYHAHLVSAKSEWDRNSLEKVKSLQEACVYIDSELVKKLRYKTEGYNKTTGCPEIVTEMQKTCGSVAVKMLIELPNSVVKEVGFLVICLKVRSLIGISVKVSLLNGEKYRGLKLLGHAVNVVEFLKVS